MVVPACSILLVAVLYVLLRPLIPSRIAVHMGPDGVIGLDLATIVSNLNVALEVVSSNSVGMGLIGFLLFFAAAASTYVTLFPRAGLDFTCPSRPDT